MKVLLLVFALAAADIPAAKPVTDGKTREEIVRLVKQMQTLFHAADARADSLLAQLNALTMSHNFILAESEKLQGTINDRTRERDNALLDAAKQAKLKWMWFSLFLVSAFSFAAFVYLKR